MGAYNPVSYHNGSVWPHDNALVAAGLMRYGFVEESQRVIMGMVDAAACFDGRLPELFSGLDRSQFAVPVPYPTACSPQAWAAGAAFTFVRTLLRLDPWIPRAKLWVDPVVPAELGMISVTNVPMAGSRLQIEAATGSARIEGLPGFVEVRQEARAPRHRIFLDPDRSSGSP
ncbi:MAG TPA: hypothetical protein VFP54_06055 [Acidimicrobiales bacterium]|nr:hypothetical protein [Acidimicrobiales bacterium]